MADFDNGSSNLEKRKKEAQLMREESGIDFDAAKKRYRRVSMGFFAAFAVFMALFAWTFLAWGGALFAINFALTLAAGGSLVGGILAAVASRKARAVRKVGKWHDRNVTQVDSKGQELNANQAQKTAQKFGGSAERGVKKKALTPEQAKILAQKTGEYGSKRPLQTGSSEEYELRDNFRKSVSEVLTRNKNDVISKYPVPESEKKETMFIVSHKFEDEGVRVENNNKLEHSLNTLAVAQTITAADSSMYPFKIASGEKNDAGKWVLLERTTINTSTEAQELAQKCIKEAQDYADAIGLTPNPEGGREQGGDQGPGNFA